MRKILCFLSFHNWEYKYFHGPHGRDIPIYRKCTKCNKDQGYNIIWKRWL